MLSLLYNGKWCVSLILHNEYNHLWAGALSVGFGIMNLERLDGLVWCRHARDSGLCLCLGQILRTGSCVLGIHDNSAKHRANMGRLGRIRMRSSVCKLSRKRG